MRAKVDGLALCVGVNMSKLVACVVCGVLAIASNASAVTTVGIGSAFVEAISDDTHLYVAFVNVAGDAEDDRKVTVVRTADGVNFSPRVRVASARSRYPLSMARFNGKFYIAWAELTRGDQICVASSGDGMAYGDVRCFDWSPGGGPSLVVARGRMYIAAGSWAIGMGSTADGVAWGDWVSIPIDRWGTGEEVGYGLAWFGTRATYWDGRFVFAINAEERDICMRGIEIPGCWDIPRIRIAESFDGRTSRTFVLEDGSIQGAPRIVAFGRALHLAWVGTHDMQLARNERVKDIEFWNEQTFVLGEQSNWAPAFGCLKRQMYMVWSGVEQGHIKIKRLPEMDSSCFDGSHAAMAILPLMLE